MIQGGPTGAQYDGTYHLILYDDDQVEVARKDFTLKGNPPDPGAASLTWPTTLQGKAYAVVTLDEAKEKNVPANPARFALLVKKPGSVSAGAPVEETAPAKEKSADPFDGSDAENGSETPSPD